MNISLGTQDKKKTIIALSLITVAVVALGWTLYSNFFSGPSAPSTATTVTSTATTVTPGGIKTVSATNTAVASPSAVGASNSRLADAATSGSQSQNPQLRLDLLALAEHTEYAGTGRNVFSAEAPAPVIEQPKAPIRPFAPVAQAPTGPPPPPPIDLLFYGYAQSKDKKKRVFLRRGDDIFIAGEGEIVDHRYRVKSIAANSVQIEDILNNNTQTISLSVGQGV